MPLPDPRDLILPDEKLELLLDAGKTFAEHWMQQSAQNANGFHPQILVAVYDFTQPIGDYSVDVHHVAGSFDGPEKRQILNQLGLKYYDEQRVPLAVMLITEAWLSTQASDAPRQYLLPEDDPQRTEAIVVQLLAFGGSQFMASRPFVRAEQSQAWSGEWNSPGKDDKFQLSLLGSFFRGFLARMPIAAGVAS